MILKKIKMPSCMQGCHGLKMLFRIKAARLTIHSEDIRMSEYYIYCDKKDEKIVRQLVYGFKERYHEKTNSI